MSNVLKMEEIIERKKEDAKRVFQINPEIMFMECVSISIPRKNITFWRDWLFRWCKRVVQGITPISFEPNSVIIQEMHRILDDILNELESWLDYGGESEQKYVMSLNFLETICIILCLKWDFINQDEEEDNVRKIKYFYYQLWRGKEIRNLYPFLLFLLEEHLLSTKTRPEV